MGTPILLLAAGFSSFILLSLPELRKWRRRRTTAEKLRVVTEALDQAEERLLRLQERHDRILYLMNSQYVSHRGMEEALAGARKAMNEALEFSAGLRRIQMRIVSSYPYGTASGSHADVSRQE